MFIPDPDLDFLPIPYTGVKKAPDPGSESATQQKTKLKNIKRRLGNYFEKASGKKSRF
jgi:hypothetical protein